MKHYELKYEFYRLRFLGWNEDNTIGYFNDIKNNKIIQFNTSKNKEALKYFWNLVEYVSLSFRREKFLLAYRLLELLDGQPATAWRAIRVSISHSTRKTTEKQLVDFLISNFGELDISFKKSGQSKLFYAFFTELVEATYSKLLTTLIDPIDMDQNKADKIIKILDQMRSKYHETIKGRKYKIHLDDKNIDLDIETRPSMMYHYSKLEEELKTYVPNRLTNPYVVWI